VSGSLDYFASIHRRYESALEKFLSTCSQAQ